MTARVMALASVGEVLVSGTLSEAASGSTCALSYRGTEVLRGVPGEWRLFAASV